MCWPLCASEFLVMFLQVDASVFPRKHWIVRKFRVLYFQISCPELSSCVIWPLGRCYLHIFRGRFCGLWVREHQLRTGRKDSVMKNTSYYGTRRELAGYRMIWFLYCTDPFCINYQRSSLERRDHGNEFIAVVPPRFPHNNY